MIIKDSAVLTTGSPFSMRSVPHKPRQAFLSRRVVTSPFYPICVQEAPTP